MKTHCQIYVALRKPSENVPSTSRLIIFQY